MDNLPVDLQEFLQNQPFLELTETKRIKCILNGHELPCNLTELQNFISGKKFKNLSSGVEFNYSQYEPHLVPSSKQPNHLFCKLTLRHINRMPHHVLRHVSGKRYTKALAQYEECVKQGVKFVPVRLKQKRRTPDTDNGMENTSERRNNHTQKEKEKQVNGIWAPSSSEGENSDSEDSMSDLYPPNLFVLKKSEEQEEMKGDDEFQTEPDDDDDDMEVSETKEEKRAAPKRKKVQSAAFNKKFRKNRKKKGFKYNSKIKNGK